MSCIQGIGRTDYAESQAGVIRLREGGAFPPPRCVSTCGQLHRMTRDTAQRFFPEKKKMHSILIVEDNLRFRQILKSSLGTYFSGLIILEAENAGKALQLLDENPEPDMVLMDISLPDESGLKLTRQIRAENPDLFIAILTTHDSDDYQEAAFEEGANAFLSKIENSFMDVMETVASVMGTPLKDLKRREPQA